MTDSNEVSTENNNEAENVDIHARLKAMLDAGEVPAGHTLRSEDSERVWMILTTREVTTVGWQVLGIELVNEPGIPWAILSNHQPLWLTVDNFTQGLTVEENLTWEQRSQFMAVATLHLREERDRLEERVRERGADYDRMIYSHQEWKDKVQARLWELGDDQEWCPQFDDALEEYGFARRPPKVRDFHVEVNVSMTVSVTVQATTEEEAREIAESESGRDGYEGLDYFVCDRVRTASYDHDVYSVEDSDD